MSQQEQGQEVASMEQNKDTLVAEKEQINGQTVDLPQETTTSEEPANISENNSDRNYEEISVNEADKNEEEKSANKADKNEEEISVNKADKNEEEKAKEEEEEKEEEEDGLAELQQDDFQASVEMSGQDYEKDKNNRPVCRYNTVCYRKIKKGNTMQRIDEFESMLNV
ncbi:ermin-like isoform X1 [Pseudorasbora parva]|uniref:ermin-like isoform X1 n=1 Tax=Pseudorasbora parva TaxID=51549 RepID=UPI00351E4A00